MSVTSLSRSKRSNVLHLHLLNHLDGVVRHGKKGPAEEDEVGEIWNCDAEIAFWSTPELFFQVGTVLTYDGVMGMGMVGDVRSPAVGCCGDTGLHFRTTAATDQW